MSKIRVEKGNALLFIEEDELAQYEARGYSKIGATKKVASKELEKELKKITKVNEELTEKIKKAEEEKTELTVKIAELEKKVK
mgnify:FL=1|jgi:hypothetical protein